MELRECGRQRFTMSVQHPLAARVAEYVTSAAEFILAGAPGALSDHAALVVDIEVVECSDSALRTSRCT